MTADFYHDDLFVNHFLSVARGLEGPLLERADEYFKGRQAQNIPLPSWLPEYMRMMLDARYAEDPDKKKKAEQWLLRNDNHAHSD